MATGGIFQLITNDGKQDRMILASELLNQRLRLIYEARKEDPNVQDPTPTLLDIERTHILFMNANFKPFAAIGYEYQEARSQAGTPKLGERVTFSIPQFGDFFNDMLVYCKLNAPTVTRTDDALLDPVSATNDAVAGRQNAPSFRWCEFPGERLLKEVSFDVNGNPLDRYNSRVYNYYREFMVTPEKQAGWNRLVGQQNPLVGHWRQPGVNYAFDETDPSASTGSPWGTVGPQSHALQQRVLTGPQTPKLTPDDLELFVPLLFWFNKDVALSIPSVAIPYGQRYISVSLASEAEMYGLVPRGSGTWGTPRGNVTGNGNDVAVLTLYINNIFVNPEIHDIFIHRIGFTLIRVHLQQVYNTSKSTDSVQLTQLKWPIETLFVAMRVADYESAQSYNLHRWHKTSQWQYSTYEVPCATGADGDGLANYLDTAIVGGAGDQAWVDDAANPTITYLLIQPGVFDPSAAGIAPGDKLQVGGATVRVQQVGVTGEDNAIGVHPVFPGITAAAPGTAIPAGHPLVGSNIASFSDCVVEAPSATRTIDTLSVKAHGIVLYQAYPSTFYDSYIPWRYGGHSVRTPDDAGSNMITFNLYPCEYQPSGHINISRSREFFIDYTSSVISPPVGANPGVTGVLDVYGKAINFLLISDGSAVLRYST